MVLFLVKQIIPQNSNKLCPMELNRIKLRICQDLQISLLFSRTNLYFDQTIIFVYSISLSQVCHNCKKNQEERRNNNPPPLPLQNVRLGLNLKIDNSYINNRMLFNSNTHIYCLFLIFSSLLRPYESKAC